MRDLMMENAELYGHLLGLVFFVCLFTVFIYSCLFFCLFIHSFSIVELPCLVLPPPPPYISFDFLETKRGYLP